MSAGPVFTVRPLDELPDGTVKIPLGLPHGAVWPVVAQVAALSQRRAGCTASIGYLAERLGMHPSTVYDALNAAGAWIVADTSTHVTRRFLAPLPEDAAWVRISYRAAAGVGCHSVQGVWTPRRNRSALFELYCRLRRDEAVGVVRSQAELAKDLDATDRTVRSMLAVLEEDGWVSRRRTGRLIAYRTHDAPLQIVTPGTVDDEAAIGAPIGPDEAVQKKPATGRSRNLSRNDLGHSGEMISEAEPAQKRDPETRLEKRDDLPLAVGEVQHHSEAGGHDALPRERQIDSGTDNAARPWRPGGALSVMTAIPLRWQLRMTERERERVLEAIEREMRRGRTTTQMSARIRRRLRAWSGQEPRRAVAAALTVIDRGYVCPRPECEDNVLPSGFPCLACEEIGARVNQQRREAASYETSPAPSQIQTSPGQAGGAPAKEARTMQAASSVVPRVDADGPGGPAEHARALLLATCPRTAATMRAAAERTGRSLPEPTIALAG
ncbi:hypothetical protein ACU635_60545 [[Actinomadura] parvosata]|uniref:hypothetical protein n=1 Tax=[Actinomadura] parvosata TaxID=1955412 RepID=UPI00406D21DA